MRNLNLEAAIWNLFTSNEFFEAAARECEETTEWFGTLAIEKEVSGFGRNNQIFDTLKALVRDFRRGAELAKIDDYRPIWITARSISGNVRGIMEQPLNSWMTAAEYQEFSGVRISRLLTYARQIENALTNAMVKGESFLDPDPECPERSNDDDGFPESEIVESYKSYVDQFKGLVFPQIPDSLPEYLIDRATLCRTAEEIPLTGVWYPTIGLDRCSLAFAIKGLRMQPAFQVVKTIDELESESGGEMFYSPETVAVATDWHPVISSGKQVETDEKLRAKAGEPCPKTGIWQPMESGASQRTYSTGETMGTLGSAYGITVWCFVAER